MWEWDIIKEAMNCKNCGRSLPEGARAFVREVSPQTAIFDEYAVSCCICFAEYVNHNEVRIRELERQIK